MTESAVPASAASAPSPAMTPRSERWVMYSLKWSATLGGVAAVACVGAVTMARVGPAVSAVVAGILLSACAAALAWRFGLGHRRKWIQPAEHMAELIEQVRRGEIPIESLSEVSGPIAPLAAIVQDLLHDLRRERQAKARIHTEMDQRIRHRTHFLEQKVVSWQTQAVRDPLTGLYNRRSLDEQFPKLLEQCRAAKMALCVMAVDVDNFKAVNDTLGHAVGDRLLRDVGQLIRSALREGDLAFRLGGDEFLIVLPGHDRPVGQQLAGRLGAMVDQLAATVRIDRRPGLSIGIVCVGQLGNVSAEDVLRQADAEMYKTKAERKGRR